MRVASIVLIHLLTVAVQTPPPKVTGDAVVGKALFENSGCVTCHSLEDPTRNIGPDLSWIGILRTPDALRQKNACARAAGAAARHLG